MDATINVESNGNGASFVINFPLSEPVLMPT